MWIIIYSIYCLLFTHGDATKEFSELFEGIEDAQMDDVDSRALYQEALESMGKNFEPAQMSLALQYKRIMAERSSFWNFTSPGTTFCSNGDVFYIKSPNFPDYPPGYPSNIKLIWDFIGDSTVSEIKITCPVISTRWDRGCNRDRVIVFWSPGGRYAKKYCGVFVNKVLERSSPVKIVFRSNNHGTRLGFLCQVSCFTPITTTVQSTTTTTTTTTTSTTTTYMPGCAMEPVCSASPMNAYQCSDIVVPNNCECTDCSGTHGPAIALYCDICTPCDMEVFANYNFSVPVNIDLKCVCTSNNFTINDYFCGNENNIGTVEYCHDADYSCIDQTAFTSVAHKYCGGPFCYDTCTKSYGPCRRRSWHPITEVRAIGTMSKGRSEVKRQSEIISFDCVTRPNMCEKTTKVCLETVQSGYFYDISPIHYRLVFNLSCTSYIQNGFLNIGENSGVDEVHLELSSSNIDHIPAAVEALLVDVDVSITYDQPPPPCNSCGNLWVWRIHSNDLDGLDVQCLHPMTRQPQSIEDYVLNNASPYCEDGHFEGSGGYFESEGSSGSGGNSGSGGSSGSGRDSGP